MNNTKMIHENPYFHYSLLKYLTLYSDKEELKDIKENNKVLHLEVEGGVYTINYNDLVTKAVEEGDKLVAKHQLGNSILELIKEANEEEDGTDE
jgi:formylmethanofuran dehydrogenase subunit D